MLCVDGRVAPMGPVFNAAVISAAAPTYAVHSVAEESRSCDLAASSQLTDAQKKAVNGFAKTLKALGYSRVIEHHDSLGMPVDITHTGCSLFTLAVVICLSGLWPQPL